MKIAIHGNTALLQKSGNSYGNVINSAWKLAFVVLPSYHKFRVPNGRIRFPYNGAVLPVEISTG